MNAAELVERARALADEAAGLAEQSAQMAEDAASLAATPAPAPVVAPPPPPSMPSLAESAGVDPLIFGLTVLVLACFVGYYVVWRVTPALHSPLMSVTNAISSVIIVGALIAAGPKAVNFPQIMAFCAVVLASINIFGGFIVTQRMLSMFRKKR